MGCRAVKIRFLLMNAYSVGGTIRATYNTAAGLADRHDVEIVSVYQRRPSSRFRPDPRVPVRALSPEVPGDERGRLDGLWTKVPSVLIPASERRYRNFTALTDLRLAGYLRSLRDGVLVTTRPGLNVAAARLAGPGVVVVGQEHLYLANHPRPLRRSIARAYPRLDLVSALTERDADDYRNLLRGRTRVVRMPNAVPEVLPRASGDSKVIVAAGRLTPQKGFDRLIPAFAAVAERHPDWRLRIFGSGTERPLLEGLVKRYRLADQVSLMGYTDRLWEEMAGAAMYVLSSRNEGFPMVLLEAMAVGLPVVSFDCRNGPADMITHGVDGLLVPQGDVARLATSICSLIEDPVLRSIMGNAARRTAATYDLPTICTRWEQLFEELVAERARRGGRRHG